MLRWRSMLFAPADNAERCAKAARAGADAVILDLEDAVAYGAKPSARAALAGAVGDVRAQGVAACVRINGAWMMAVEDLRAAVGAGADAIMVPKVECPHDLSVIAAMVAELRGAPLPVIALIESPRGVAQAQAIADLPCVAGLALGTEDFSLAVGVEPSSAVLDLPARQLALAAAGGGLMALAVPFSIARFREEEAYRAIAGEAAAYGVNGAICIHPKQVAVANDIFGLSPAAREEAERIWAAWEEARARGLSVVTLDGRMIDLPVAERARKALARP
ncbi:citrate lyase subunit beta/citryl-CoA lyase [Novosphingobium sp. SG751A]|uniref:HpcH/HpaI aldolase/citrate lyase family protein n=1 Tax=Novosphingobium sp. SG751A TaxID=2587000 RepID=UPI001555AE5D|nr:aldolase/citrate lyase family protein [Novosphingobium sp. SG751A]NOW48188.1 citrate lyase subunit beta/citryl-CoA lyase [Novosphingobium sp. SG751A]